MANDPVREALLGNNEGRNMMEVVDFHNGSDFPLEMEYDGQFFGVCGPHETVKVPRFVGEHYMRRNLNYSIVQSDATVQAIEAERQELESTENIYDSTAREEAAALKQLKQRKAAKAQLDAEKAAEKAALAAEEAEEDSETEEVEESPVQGPADEVPVDAEPKKK